MNPTSSKSKKPSEIIRKKVFNYAGQENSFYAPSDLTGRTLLAVIEYLDELHEEGKVKGE